MPTIVYVDGFNLYYGAVRDTPYKWLDLDALCRLLLPSDSIVRIKYFTARVKPLADPGQPVRQQTYLRALAALPNLEIIFGQFYSHEVRMPLAARAGHGVVWVTKAEEKGSDVALATHLVHDAHRGLYDTAAIVSNDSDLVPPVRIVRTALGKQVGILSPRNPGSVALERATDFVHFIHRSQLQACQFPPTLRDATGAFHKPASWA
jgi:uncharacterized LabA/DUF88 family protein